MNPVYSEKRKLFLRPETLDDFVAREAHIYINDTEPIPDDVVLDIGGNIGAVTAAFLRAGVKRVVTIEPEHENILMLERNLGQEEFHGRALIIPGAVVSDEYPDSMIALYVNNQKNQGSHRTRPTRGRDSIDVPAVKFSDLVSSDWLDGVTIVKCDIEGGEYEIADELVDKMPPTVRALTMEMHVQGKQRESGIKLDERLRAAGWDLTRERGSLEKTTTWFSLRTYERAVSGM
jgi:FkbM family methyltransferase